MINQCTSIRNTNHFEDVEAKVSNRSATNDNRVSIINPDYDEVILAPASIKSRDVLNECIDSDVEANEFALNATVSSTATTKTEMKINFSVDRLLNKTDVDREKCANSNISNNLWKNGQKSVLTIDQLLSSTRNDQQHSKQIVRPMPMRYLQSTTAQAAVKSATAMYSVNGPQSIHMQHYLKYINSNTSNFNAHQFAKQQQQSHQIPSPANSPTVCSGGRYLDTFTTPKPPYASGKHFNSTTSVVSTDSPTGHVKRKRSWSRAVFSQLQRKGLEIQFQIQKYITKPDRRKLASRLGLTDAQVKVWFQNRRMKWRHTRETKLNAEKKCNRQTIGTGEETANATSEDDDADDLCSADGSSDEDEIDVVAE